MKLTDFSLEVPVPFFRKRNHYVAKRKNIEVSECAFSGRLIAKVSHFLEYK